MKKSHSEGGLAVGASSSLRVDGGPQTLRQQLDQVGGVGLVAQHQNAG